MRDVNVRRMFQDIAFSYDFQNSMLSLRRDSAWRRVLADAIEAKSGVVLDAATGTGEVALEIRRRRPALSVLGCDFSPAMLAKAAAKVAARGVAGIDLAVADCRALPVADGSVAAVTIAFGLRNIEERIVALAEFHRVLRPGGRAYVMEFGIPGNPVLRRLYRLYFDHVLPPFGNFLSRSDYAYSYLVTSVDAFPREAAFLAEMEAAGFVDTTVKDLTFGVAKIYSGRKGQP